MHLIITGEVNTGKTSWCLGYAEDLKAQGIPIGGVLCLPVFNENEKIGYDAQDLRREVKVPIGRDKKDADFCGIEIGNYKISNEGLNFASNAIMQAVQSRARIVFIDELGKLEIKGEGLFAASVKAYKKTPNTVTIIRKSMITSYLQLFASILPDIEFTVLEKRDTGYILPPSIIEKAKEISLALNQ